MEVVAEAAGGIEGSFAFGAFGAAVGEGSVVAEPGGVGNGEAAVEALAFGGDGWVVEDGFPDFGADFAADGLGFPAVGDAGLAEQGFVEPFLVLLAGVGGGPAEGVVVISEVTLALGAWELSLGPAG